MFSFFKDLERFNCAQTTTKNIQKPVFKGTSHISPRGVYCWQALKNLLFPHPVNGSKRIFSDSPSFFLFRPPDGLRRWSGKPRARAFLMSGGPFSGPFSAFFEVGTLSRLGRFLVDPASVLFFWFQKKWFVGCLLVLGQFGCFLLH